MITTVGTFFITWWNIQTEDNPFRREIRYYLEIMLQVSQFLIHDARKVILHVCNFKEFRNNYTRITLEKKATCDKLKVGSRNERKRRCTNTQF